MNKTSPFLLNNISRHSQRSCGGFNAVDFPVWIEAMSDRRGEPRNMPPKLKTNGLEDLPTLVSNVETFAWSPYIIINGGKNYAALGVNGRQDRRFFSVSGDVKRSGVYELPMGLTLRELLQGGGQAMSADLIEGLFIRDDDEGLFSRDIDGQLVRLDSPTESELFEGIDEGRKLLVLDMDED